MAKSKRCVVTGSNGFIGRNLVNRLRLYTSGIQVIELDSATGCNILDHDKLDRQIADADYVFHMAVLPFNPCTLDPRLCIETNVTGTLNVVNACKSAGVKKLVYSSASTVYGNIDRIQSVDETHPCNPDSLYGASKLMGELLVKNAGIPHVILRYMNVYGSGQRNGLIPSVLSAIADKVSPVIYGGLQTFDFVHVDDIVDANILAAESNIVSGEFNIGGENEITVKDVVLRLLEASGSGLRPVYRTGQPARRVGSSAKARKWLGYTPKAQFNEKLKELVREHTNNQTVPR